jgi:translocation and assembly module TamA
VKTRASEISVNEWAPHRCTAISNSTLPRLAADATSDSLTRRCTRAALVVVALAVIAGCARDTHDELVVQTVAAPGIAYTAKLSGSPNDELQDLLERSLRLFSLAERPPPSVARLKRRLETDIDTALRVLKAEGYYEASVNGDIAALPSSSPGKTSNIAATGAGRDDGTNTSSTARLATVSTGDMQYTATVQVDAGQRFTLGELSVRYVAPDGFEAPANTDTLPPLSSLPAPIFTAARAEDIVAAEGAVVIWLKDNGYPDARQMRREAVADLDLNTLGVTTFIHAGTKATLGELRYEGLTSVSESYLRKVQPWVAGARFSQSTLDSMQRNLAGSGLFEVVSVEFAQPGEGQVRHPDVVPVSVKLTEAPHRTVGGGLRFDTDVGPSARAFVEHRNLWGGAEKARATATGSIALQELTLELEKPAFLRSDQALVFDGVARHEDDEAFDELTVGATAALERQLTRQLRVSGGLSAEFIRIRESNADGDALLFGTPLGINYDTTDNRLDATRGVRAGAALTPYVGTFDGQSIQFAVTDINASTYLAIDPDANFVVAVRGRVGSLMGAARDSVPANKRLYSGGGGSVRGYESRFIGPLDVDGDPLGGRSVVELGLELRAKVTQSIGVVPFFEAGAVSKDWLPDFDDGVQYAAGLGVRYYTPVGPLRADVAVPLNGRSEDDAFQFYISIGQAF